MQQHTGIELLAADLGTTPDRLAIYLLAFFMFLVICIVYACVKLNDIPPGEGWPDDPRPPKPGPALPRGQKDRWAA